MSEEDVRLEALKAAVTIAPKGVPNASQIVLAYATEFAAYLTTGATGSGETSGTRPRGAARPR